eukprot:TRINITY_DN24879_c0_g2_i3.p1 TRINITY_DN24879_c0_g2~~TRINITY_DN24879_c0_g2_i3.p1  ORF type:complete len:212 (-),score=-23.83 TRINITY_DN24879_c0_g2_i3:875-1510(-)
MNIYLIQKYQKNKFCGIPNFPKISTLLILSQMLKKKTTYNKAAALLQRSCQICYIKNNIICNTDYQQLTTNLKSKIYKKYLSLLLKQVLRYISQHQKKNSYQQSYSIQFKVTVYSPIKPNGSNRDQYHCYIHSNDFSEIQDFIFCHYVYYPIIDTHRVKCKHYFMKQIVLMAGITKLHNINLHITRLILKPTRSVFNINTILRVNFMCVKQ